VKKIVVALTFFVFLSVSFLTALDNLNWRMTEDFMITYARTVYNTALSNKQTKQAIANSENGVIVSNYSHDKARGEVTFNDLDVLSEDKLLNEITSTMCTRHGAPEFVTYGKSVGIFWSSKEDWYTTAYITFHWVDDSVFKSVICWFTEESLKNPRRR
jgi:hypothetical protein